MLDTLSPRWTVRSCTSASKHLLCSQYVFYRKESANQLRSIKMVSLTATIKILIV